MGRVEQQAAFILHQRQYRNTSLILDVITLNHGRVGIVARGVRNSKKNTASQLQPFRQLLLSWTGRGELFSLTDVEEANFDPSNIRLTGEALFCGYYVNELTLKLLPQDDPHEDIFVLYNQTINHLYGDQSGVEPALRYYELALLESLGYQLALHNEVNSGDVIDEDTAYCYVVDRGPVYADLNQAPGINISGRTLLALANWDFSSSDTRVESRRLLRVLINQQLDGRPLKSRELFRSVFRSGLNRPDPPCA